MFEFEFDSEFIRKLIEIRNIEILGFENEIYVLQNKGNKWIASMIFRPVRLIISHYNG